MITAIIPAKGTSQRVPRKNTQIVGGETLVDRAITFAKSMPEIDQIIVSTESLDLILASSHLSKFELKFAKSHENSVIPFTSNIFIHKRLSVDAEPQTKTIDVLKSIHRIFNGLNSEILLLQPTSPFRFKAEFQSLLSLFRKHGDDVFSAKRVESPHPLKCFAVDENQNLKLTSDLIKNLGKPTQQLPSFFTPDGAYYLNSLQRLLSFEQFINPRSRILIRDPNFNINIDTPEELEIARAVAKSMSCG